MDGTENISKNQAYRQPLQSSEEKHKEVLLGLSFGVRNEGEL